MAEYFAFTKLVEAGGATLLLLVACSILSFIIIIERMLYFRAKSFDSSELLNTIKEKFISDNGRGVSEVLANRGEPVSYVLSECFYVGVSEDGLFEEVKSRAIAEKIPEMERYLNIEATLASVSPFIGLLGTVFGIIRSFQSLGGGTGAEKTVMTELNAGIAEALIATAAGLFVAIPATIAYNYFRKRVSDMVLEMEISASRLKVMMKGKL